MPLYIKIFMAFGGMSLIIHMITEIIPRLVALGLGLFAGHPSVQLALKAALDAAAKEADKDVPDVGQDK